MHIWQPVFHQEDLALKKKEDIFQGHVSLHKTDYSFPLFAGGHSHLISREVIEAPHSVGVLPYDLDKEVIVLIEQCRIGAYCAGEQPWILEPVAGLIDSQEDKTHTARRETKEEIGSEILTLTHAIDYLPSPGILSEKCSLYCAKVKAPAHLSLHGLAEEGEDIRVHLIPFADIPKILENNLVLSALTVISLQWFLMNKEKLIKK